MPKAKSKFVAISDWFEEEARLEREILADPDAAWGELLKIKEAADADRLTIQERLFVFVLLHKPGITPRAASEMAGYTSGAMGTRLLRRPHIQRQLALHETVRRYKEAMEAQETGRTLDKAIAEFMKVGVKRKKAKR